MLFNTSLYLIVIGLAGFFGYVGFKWFKKGILKKVFAGLFALLSLAIASVALISLIDFRILLPAVSTNNITKSQWMEDFEFLDKSLQIHPLYNDSLAQIISIYKSEIAKLSEVSDHQAFITAIKMVGLFNDGHSLTMPLPLYIKKPKYLPIQTHVFADGIYITNASPDQELIGGRIVSIDGQPIEKIYSKVSSIIGSDNLWSVKFHSGLYLPNMDVLKGLGIVSSTGEANLEVMINNELITKQLKAVSAVKWSLWTISSTKDHRPVGWNMRTPKIEIEIKNDTLLWMTFNEVGQEPVLTDIGNKIHEQAYGKTINHFVIDMRNNGGGDNYTYNDLIKRLSETDIEITMLTSRKTYSAAINFISELQLTGKAFRIIGEPTGAGHNHSGDPETIFLPNSGLMANISTKPWHFIPEISGTTITPDIFITYRSSDYFNNNDPWLKVLKP